MAKKKKTAKGKKIEKAGCICGGSCTDRGARLPGYLLIAFGLLALPINYDLIASLEFARAWPLFLVIFGFVLLAKVQICKIKGVS
ncbi:hypothetical protein H0O02_02805 [Candidatus Micrarchaeota archaeon]|nr:hypothetical protein [Candidatus Micrarchaeota archaeon]